MYKFYIKYQENQDDDGREIIELQSMDYSCDSGLDNSVETPFRMEDYVVFSNQNPKQECMTDCSSTLSLGIPANLVDDCIETNMSERYFIASSPTESGSSGYCSSSDENSTNLIPLSVKCLSSNNSSHSFYQAKSDKTRKCRNQPKSSSLESHSSKKFSLNIRGRPLQKKKVYDDEIDKAIAANDPIQLKIARNKKSSQIYRLKNKIIALKAEKKYEKLENKNLKLIEKLKKITEINLKLKEFIFLSNL